MARTPKGRARTIGSLQRKRATRVPYDRILIVCEGTKTEPNYFGEIRKEAQLSTVAIRILSSQKGTAPRQVVEYAESVFEKTKQFEKVFAVFDRDNHSTYADAIRQAESLNGKLKNDEGKPIIKPARKTPAFTHGDRRAVPFKVAWEGWKRAYGQ